MRTMRPACAAALVFTCLPAGCGEEETVCGGLPTACDSIATAEVCRLQAGCAPAPRCVGEPHPCAAQPTPSACGDQPGCAWQPATCRGTAQTCDSFDRIRGGDDCARQLGCTWDAGTRICSGSSAACGILNQTACREQNGCAWLGSCDGSPTPCAAWTTNIPCGAANGCRWDPDLCLGDATPCSDLPVDLCAWQEGCHAE